MLGCIIVSVIWMRPLKIIVPIINDMRNLRGGGGNGNRASFIGYLMGSNLTDTKVYMAFFNRTFWLGEEVPLLTSYQYP